MILSTQPAQCEAVHCSASSIAGFLATHTPLAGNIKLPDAPFWTHAQAELLREAVVEDSDWAGSVDQLDGALRVQNHCACRSICWMPSRPQPTRATCRISR